MNEFQEALLNIRYFYAQAQKYKKMQKYNATRQLETLQELVNRATPKKPVEKKFNEATMWDCADYFVERNACPTCKIKIINKSDFCPCCGQAIDWS